jgi:hypothetical protein
MDDAFENRAAVAHLDDIPGVDLGASGNDRPAESAHPEIGRIGVARS